MKIYGVDHNSKLGQLAVEWFNEKQNVRIFPPYSLIVIVENEDIKGVIFFYDHQTKGNIDIHLYTPRCVTRSNINYVYDYVFGQLECTRLTAKIERKNKKMLALVPRFGFEYEATLKKFFGPNKDNDAIVYVLYREDLNGRP